MRSISVVIAVVMLTLLTTIPAAAIDPELAYQRVIQDHSITSNVPDTGFGPPPGERRSDWTERRYLATLARQEARRQNALQEDLIDAVQNQGRYYQRPRLDFDYTPAPPFGASRTRSPDALDMLLEEDPDLSELLE